MSDYQRRAAAFGAEIVDLAKVSFTTELLRCVPAELVRKYRVLPVADSGDRVAIALSDPSDLSAIDDLTAALAREIEVRVADEAQLDSFIERFYGDDKPAA